MILRAFFKFILLMSLSMATSLFEGFPLHMPRRIRAKDKKKEGKFRQRESRAIFFACKTSAACARLCW